MTCGGDSEEGKQGDFLEEEAFELCLEGLWQMEMETGVVWRPSVPRLGGRSVPGCVVESRNTRAPALSRGSLC